MAGNIYLIPSNLEFSYGCGGSMSKLYAHINLLGYNNYDLLSSCPRCIVLENRQTEIDDVISWWRQGDILSSLSIKTAFYRTVLEALQQEHISFGEIETYSDLVKRALQIIKKNPHLSLTAQKLAEMLFVSPSQLQKIPAGSTRIPGAVPERTGDVFCRQSVTRTGSVHQGDQRYPGLLRPVPFFPPVLQLLWDAAIPVP